MGRLRLGVTHTLRLFLRGVVGELLGGALSLGHVVGDRQGGVVLPLVISSTLLFLMGVAFCYFFVFGQVFAFIQGFAPARTVPYLADVARVEWALHTCASAADAELQAATLALLGSHDLDTLRLQLAPGTTVLCSPWPAASLVQAHLHEGVTLAEAATRLRAGQAEDVLVWRQGYRPRVRQAPR